jgi:hypothetical protein
MNPFHKYKLIIPSNRSPLQHLASKAGKCGPP